MIRQWLPLAPVALLTACAAASTAPPANKPSNAPQATAAAPAPATREAAQLPALTAEEAELAVQLAAQVRSLTQLGERNVLAPLSYADATDWVAMQLEAQGFTVDRQGYSVGTEVAQNLVVHTPGLALGREHIVIAARLDSAVGSVGSDDNASGVAALLALSQRFYGKRTQRSIDWVWIADAGARRDTAAIGTGHFLKVLQQNEVQVRAMVELYGLGAYSSQPGSQRYSDELPGTDPVAAFLGLVTYPQHAMLSEHFLVGLQAGSLPIKRFTGLSDSPAVPNALHTDFLAAGIPALLVYDTHGLRYPEFGTAADTWERLDYARMARAVVAVSEAVATLAGGFVDMKQLGASPAQQQPEAQSAYPEAAQPAKP